MTRSICIFCDKELVSDTKPEHVLLSALGGRKTTRLAICTKHNEDFGGTIDDALAKQVAFIRNQLQLESGTGKPPPALGPVQAGARTIRIDGDGQPRLTEKPFQVTPLGDRKFQVQITTSSAAQVEKYLPHIAAQAGIDEDQLRSQLKEAEVSLISERPGTIYRPNPLGGELECRSMLKACLVLWATGVGNAELKSTPYKAARDHVLSGGRFPAGLDSRPLPIRDALITPYGKFFNLIYVASNELGRVVGRFTLYNLISWRFVLAESGGIRNRRIALISNPQKPNEWSDQFGNQFNLDVAWMDQPTFETSGPQGQLAAVLEEAQRDGFERGVARIVADVWRRHGLEPDEPVSDPNLMRAMTGEISHRVAHHIMGLPFEEKITGAELLARAQKKER